MNVYKTAHHRKSSTRVTFWCGIQLLISGAVSCALRGYDSPEPFDLEQLCTCMRDSTSGLGPILPSCASCLEISFVSGFCPLSVTTLPGCTEKGVCGVINVHVVTLLGTWRHKIAFMWRLSLTYLFGDIFSLTDQLALQWNVR